MQQDMYKMNGLTDILENLYKSDEYPLHMPGHKRCDMGILSDAYHLDITEIEGYDNLYDAKGILKEAMDFAGRMYGCAHTYFLVNGSTTGILTGISAIADKGDTLIVASNCHRSVFSAAKLNRLEVKVVAPEHIDEYDIDGEITAKSIWHAIEEIKDSAKIVGVVITSPTYDGVISDIESIATTCHSYDIPLIVDEAHGAHFSLSALMPKSAIEYGADIVIHSTHKTLAAMTQTALMHVQGLLADISKIEEYWHTFQTSSPSYVLMASIDAALREIDKEGEGLFEVFTKNRKAFMWKCRDLKKLRIIPDEVAADPCKIVVSTLDTDVSGIWLQNKLLDDYHIQLEMASDNRIVAIVTYYDTEEGFNRFADALISIDEKIANGEVNDIHRLTQASGASDDKKNLYAPCIPGQV